jgi:hypothetical protein
MATAASLDGIQQYGLGWRAQVKSVVPADIPSLFEGCETTHQLIKLGHEISFNAIASLNRLKPQFPKDSIESLDDIIEQLKDSFIYEDIEGVKDWHQDEQDSLCEYLEAEMLGQLNDLYDWADYYRICFLRS